MRVESVKFSLILVVFMMLVMNAINSNALGEVTFYNSFDGTVDAQIGVDPTATVHEGSAQFQPGKRGQAFLAGDGNPYLSFDITNLPTKEGTIEFWIQPIDWDAISTATFHVWVETGNDGNGAWFVFYKYYDDQTIRFIREGSESLVERKNHTWNGWIHLAITWSDQGSRIYWNGTTASILKPTNIPDEYPGPLLIGDRPWGSDIERHNERTLMDEFYIYDRALEPEEVMWAFKNADTREAGTEVPAGLVPMKVHAKILPTKEKIIAEVRHWLDDDTRSELTGTAELVGPTPLAPVSFTLGEHTANAELTFDHLTEGDYKLRVSLKNDAGEIVDEAEDKFFVPANEWLGNTIGISDTPPPPFTAIEASASSISFLGREYLLGPSGFPRQIASTSNNIQEDMLAYPISLRASMRGSDIKWQYGPVDMTKQSAVAAEYEGQWQGSKPTSAAVTQYVGPGGTKDESGDAILQMDWKAVAEYDGMVKYTLTLTPTGDPVELNNLELRFPLHRKFATLINSGAKVGAVPEGRGKLISASTANWWWLGNEDRGLAAFCESDEAWDRIDRPNGFRVQRRGKAIEAVWSFIGSKTTLDGPWTFTFGMTATPVKDTAGLSGRPSRVMNFNRWLMDTPMSYSDAGLPVMIENEGIRDKIWSNFHILWLGGPWTQYTLDWRSRPTALEFMPEGIDKLKAKGLSPLQYFLPREVTESIPEWRYWSDEWTGNKKVNWTNEMWDSTTCTQSWADFIVWYIMNNVKRYGFSGIYIDNSLPMAVINPDVGAGYMRDGKMRPTTPWFAMREIMKRLYTATKFNAIEKNEPSMVMAHMSGELAVANLGFMDNRLDGEQYRYHFMHKKMAPHEVITLDTWRARFLSSNMGNMSSILTYSVQGSRNFVALLLLHNADMWINQEKDEDLVALHDMWQLQDDFGVQDSELLPYWKNEKIIRGQTDTLKVTAYKKTNGGTLMVIANLEKAATDTTLHIDWSKLKSPGELVVTDAQTGEVYEANGSSLDLSIPALDYKAIIVQ